MLFLIRECAGNEFANVVDLFSRFVPKSFEHCIIPCFVDHALEQGRQGFHTDPLTQTIQHGDKGLQFARGTRKIVKLIRATQNFHETKPAFFRDLTRFCNGGISDAASRHVDDPKKMKVVIRILQHAKVSKNVLDLRAVIKANARKLAVRKSAFRKNSLQCVCLCTHAVKYGTVTVLALPFADELRDAICQKDRFLFLIGQTKMADLLTIARFTPEIFPFSLLIVRNDGICRGEDVSRRAVILFQIDALRITVNGVERENVLDGGAAKFIDRLIVVTDYHNITAHLGHQLHKMELHGIGILILVDQDVRKAALVIKTRFFKLFKQFNGFDENIVKIQGV